MKYRAGNTAALVLASCLTGTAIAAPRDIQIRSVDFGLGIVELHNFGDTTEALDGWQFCTFDEDESFQYTFLTGMNGLSIAAGESLFVHTLGDAPAEPNRINVSSLGGGFARPVDTTNFVMSLYGAGSGFISPDRMVDHLMWNANGVPGANDGRASVAVAAGLWSATSDWISTTDSSMRTRLTDENGGLLHDSSDYEVVNRLVDPLPTPIAQGAVHLELGALASGLTAPNWGIAAPDQEDRLYVSDQDGILWAIDLKTGDKTVFLDVASRLVPLGIGGPDSFDERGLLGFAFHVDYSNNGLLYTYTSEPADLVADFSTMPIGETPNHQTVILEWEVPAPNDPGSVVDPGSARELLRIDEPQFNHNAGAMNFGPDGMLYISLGDGGGADDMDGQPFFGAPLIGHGPGGNGQDPGNILGTVLRIDPDGSDSVNAQYGIPADNPFVNDGQKVDEIFAYGFRNPFRFSFDSMTGTLYVADVGQNDIEEIDLVISGGNYGWNLKEGTFFFDPNGVANGFVTDVDPGNLPALIDPVAQYDHDEGLAVIGGFVYRGQKIPPLFGHYVFGDFARTFSNDGRLFYLDGNDDVVEFPLVGQSELGLSLLGFAQDSSGEIYVLANTTGIPFGSTGVVLRISTLPGDGNGDGSVDLADFVEFAGCLGGPGANTMDGCAHMDLNMDSQVDLRDTAMFQRGFTGAP